MKRIGILACDQVGSPLGEVHGEYADMFARLLATVARDVDLVSYRVHAGEFPADADACDAYILTGSRRSVYEDLPWIRRLEEFLRLLHARERRVVGICFGHQLIGQAMGGRAARAAQGWGLGRQVVDIIDSPDWMRPRADHYAVFVANQDQVVALPPGARRLARSAQCEHAMFVQDDRFLGIQGHPEFSAAFARAITENKRGIAPDTVIEAALPTFADAVDSALLARWIVAFITR